MNFDDANIEFVLELKIMKNRRRFISYFLIFIATLGISHGLLRLAFGYFNSIKRNDEVSIFNTLSDKKVLYISSYNNSFDNVEMQIRGLKSIFDPANIAMDVQYMDMLNFDSKMDFEIFRELLHTKLSRRNSYDSIVIGDDFALSFLLDYYDEYFKDIPVVFMGVDDEKLAKRASDNPFATGFIEQKNLRDTVEIAIKLCPKSRIIYAIYDDSPLGLKRQTEFFSIKSDYSGYLFRGIDASDYTREGLGNILDIIEDNNIVVCLGVSEDKDKNWYSSADTTAFVSSHVEVPVFSDNFYTVGRGFAGGKVINYEKMAKNAALLVKKIIEGSVDIKDVPVEKVESEYFFDSDVMKKFKLNEKILTNAAYLNKTKEYWSKYHAILSPFVEIFVFLLVIFAILIANLIEVYKSRKVIAYSAGHDALTGLYNRYSIMSRLEKVIKSGIKFAVLQIDVDGFRSINDFNSYKCGDFVLKVLAERIKSLCDDGNYEASRFDGDSFLLIYKGANLSENDPELYFLRQLFGNEINYKEKKFFIRTSAGIVNSQSLFAVDDYLANVDIATHIAKTHGRSKYVIFNDEMKKNILRNSEIGHILEEACTNDDFNVVYQPQIDAKSGEIYGYEALVRLPENRLSPGVFIPIAEKDGHIAKIGRIVTEKVIKQMADWRESGQTLHRVSINFSVGQMADKSYIPFLSKLMRTYEIPADLIGIEITESLFLENKQQALDLFKQFDSLGIKIALDDFGTGYSSLNYLTYLPIHTVKLDKSTVDTYLDGQASFIENIVNLVHSLGMKLTVEGVEEKWQYDKLKSFNCDYIQGYFFSKPLSGEDIKTFVPKRVE